MPVHQVITFPATDAFAADPVGVLKKAGEFFGTADGCLGVFAGIAEEEKTGSILIIWESYEHHKAIIDSPGYPDILGLKPAINGEHKLYHLDFNQSPKACVMAPTTEVVIMKLKDGKKKEELDAVLSAADPKLMADDGFFGPAAWGATRQSPDTIICLLGWESSKKHLEVVGKPTHKSFVEGVKAVVDAKMVHVSFKQVL